MVGGLANDTTRWRPQSVFCILYFPVANDTARWLIRVLHFSINLLWYFCMLYLTILHLYFSCFLQGCSRRSGKWPDWLASNWRSRSIRVLQTDIYISLYHFCILHFCICHLFFLTGMQWKERQMTRLVGIESTQSINPCFANHAFAALPSQAKVNPIL